MDTKKKKLKTTNSPSVILKLENIKPNSKITLFNIAHLLKMKWTLSQGLLAEMGGVSVRTINRCLVELEESGFIKRETKLFNGKGKETKYVILWDNITQYTKETDWYENDNKMKLDIPTHQQEVEEPTEPLKTAIEIPTEQEMKEILMDDKDIVNMVVKEFIETEGDAGYNMFVKLNNTNPNSDEHRILWNKWLCKWNRYITTDRRMKLKSDITNEVSRLYYLQMTA
jgi:DNA-binding Lrp family transcriptional regulator